jgi:hypothetical protein
MIRGCAPCDVYRIEAVDPYPEGHDETVTRIVEEQDAPRRGSTTAMARPTGVERADGINIRIPIEGSDVAAAETA